MVRGGILGGLALLACGLPLYGQGVRQLEGHRAAVSALAFHPDGQHLASASFDHTLKLWDVGAGCVVRTCRGHRDKVLALVFSPDGRWLASAGLDGAVRLWDGRT